MSLQFSLERIRQSAEYERLLATLRAVRAPVLLEGLAVSVYGPGSVTSGMTEPSGQNFSSARDLYLQRA
jgi:hypothetical protein